jgi:PAS domain S-box-containing protein
LLQGVAKNLEWDLGALWLVDKEAAVLRCTDTWQQEGIVLAGFHRLSRALALGRGIGLPGHVWNCGSPAWVSDDSPNPWLREPVASSRTPLRGVLAFPILVGPEILGVLEFFSEERQEPGAALLETLWLLGNQIGQFVKRKRAEEESCRSEACRAALLDASRDAIFIIDNRATIIDYNPAAEAIFGYAREEILGKDLAASILPPALRQSFQEGLEACNTPGTNPQWTNHRDLVGLQADGTELPVDIVITRVGDIEPTQYTVCIRDLSERKRAEEALRQAEEKFRQAQKMAAIGQLAGGIAHDFNNLLTIINGYCDLLLVSLRPGDPAHKSLEQIHKAGNRAASLTRHLLAFSRKQVLDPAVLNLSTVLSDLSHMLRRLIGEHIELVTVLTPDAWLVKADLGQMEQVIMNLAINARDAMPHGGRLTLEISNQELSGTEGAAGTLPGPYVELSVRDNGCGMDDEVKARIFEPFFTTKGLGKGTGLGLATVHSIVKQSGGFVTFQSEVWKGTRFRIFLPRMDTTVSLSSEPPSRSPSGPGTETILLVEDENDVRTIIREMLQLRGYTVLEARQAYDAFLVWENHFPAIQLLITDVVMPGRSGKQLAQQILEQQAQMKVLYISGHTDDEFFDREGLTPGAGFLAKPFTPEALEEKVRCLLSEEKVVVTSR